ncbi:MAG: NADH-quinone oxidoreductase subunit J [Bacteroidota bacterium]
MEQIFFYILAAVILVFSYMTVTTRRILRAAVYLLLVLLGTAGLYFMFNYSFLAAVQLTVYAGGIVVLIIFSILLTHQLNELLEMPSRNRMLMAGIGSLLGAGVVISVITSFSFEARQAPAISTDIETIGTQLLSYNEGGYVLPFEVISVLLLAAMVGAIIIAKRKKPVEVEKV